MHRFLSAIRQAAWTALLVHGLAHAGSVEDVEQAITSGQYPAAVNIADKALETDPSNQQLMILKGVAIVKTGELDRALEYFKLVRDIFPNTPIPRNNIGMVYRLQKKYALAIDEFENTIRMFPDYIHAYSNLGDTYIDLAGEKYQKGVDATGDGVLHNKALLSGSLHAMANDPVIMGRILNINSQTAIGQDAPEPGASDSVKESLNNNNEPENGNPITRPEDQSGMVKSIADLDQVASEATKESSVDIETKQEVIRTLESWVNGWMSGDPVKYFSHYSQEFKPQGEETLETWIARKRDNISKAEFINVLLTDINFELVDKYLVTTSFTQKYQSNTYQSVDNKKLTFAKAGNRWMIIEELLIDT